MLELAQLAEKDPEFFKYLEENDRELLEFQGDDDISVDEEEEGPEEESEEDKVPTLTMAILKKWQKALLEVRFRRKTLIRQLNRGIRNNRSGPYGAC
jgi:nucleolar complex protein 2